jgi:membrane complex biogenesis BtpA family protein
MLPLDRHPLTFAPGRVLLIGVVHLTPLPGAPGHAGSLARVLDLAAADAQALAEGGADAILVENFGDRPFRAERVDPETIGAMSLALVACRHAAPHLPLGVNVLRNDARAALGIAAATPASFVRINVHTGVAVADQGLLSGRADETLRERGRLGLDCPLLCDVHVKHATPLGGGDLVDAARDASERGLADALVLSGVATGHAPTAEALQRVRRALPDARLVLGSGLDLENAARFRPLLDAAICGTALKREGRVELPVESERVARLRDALRESP